MAAAVLTTTRGMEAGLRQKVSPASAPCLKVSPSRSTAVGLPLFLQPKLAISQPNDPTEQEADRVADSIIRMPEPAHEDSARSAMYGKVFALLPKSVQRQEAEPPTGEERTEPPRFLRHDFDLRLDWFEMARPFVTRGAERLLYFDDGMYRSIGNVWVGNYRFFFNFGLNDKLSAEAANFFTPFAIDSALKHDYETSSERFEREADISSLIFSPTVFQFDLHNIPGTLRMPFLKIFGAAQPNPYARGSNR